MKVYAWLPFFRRQLLNPDRIVTVSGVICKKITIIDQTAAGRTLDDDVFLPGASMQGLQQTILVRFASTWCDSGASSPRPLVAGLSAQRFLLLQQPDR
jgi:hypothetical protein